MVQTLPQQGAWVQSLVGELESCMQCGGTKNKKKKKKQQQRKKSPTTTTTTKGTKEIDEINLNNIFYLTQYNQSIIMST